MNMMKKSLWFAFSIVLMGALYSPQSTASDNFTFNNVEQEKMYQQIISQLRCPKCQNQTIADSDQGISKDLRYIVYQKVMNGEAQSQILNYMQERYGEFVLYDPPVKPSNYALWLMPFVVFLVIITAVVRKVGRQQLNEPEEPETTDAKNDSE